MGQNLLQKPGWALILLTAILEGTINICQWANCLSCLFKCEHLWFLMLSRFDTSEEDNFSQPAVYWNSTLSGAERQRVVENIALSLGQTYPQIKVRK